MRQGKPKTRLTTEATDLLPRVQAVLLYVALPVSPAPKAAACSVRQAGDLPLPLQLLPTAQADLDCESIHFTSETFHSHITAKECVLHL